ncbi:hypothetical protein [Streptomyces cinerochromogenes]|uniref:hypothetical protein n=1 Tax=Streptomyces cinerochromogenes TaxID=66422 RepID=UPI00199D6635|nr:hypothetical protein [Streptomyces cinerochromogenes]GGS54765.1 hypothetical protein GCM10010206_15620 [Streptomyces cinerochromogenes]
MRVRARVDGGRLLVRLPWRMAVAARRRVVRAPLEAVSEVRVEPSWWRALRLGTPGRHYRFRAGRWCAGELVHARGRDLVALVAGEPALVVDLLHPRSPYARLALSVPDPHGLAAALRHSAAPDT